MIHDAPAAYEMMKPHFVAIVEMGGELPPDLSDVDLDPATVKIAIRLDAVFRKLGSEGDSGVIHCGYKFTPAT